MTTEKERLSVLNGLHRGQMLAVSIRSSQDDLLAWIGVYPLDRMKNRNFIIRNGGIPDESTRYIYAVRKLEIRSELIEKDIWPGPSDLLNSIHLLICGDDELEIFLKKFDVKIEDLKLPDRSNYPI